MRDAGVSISWKDLLMRVRNEGYDQVPQLECDATACAVKVFSTQAKK